MTTSGLAVRTVLKLEHTTQSFDLDWLRETPEFLPGTVISEHLPTALATRIDQVSRTSIVQGRWFLYRDDTGLRDGWSDDSVDAYRTLQAIPVALLATLNPNLRFGPILQARHENASWNFVLSWEDDLARMPGAGRRVEGNYFNYDQPPNCEDLARTAAAIAASWNDRLVRLIRDRFVRACGSENHDTIVHLAIALEVLFPPKRRAKREDICRHSAAALGDSAVQREAIYRDTGALYLFRNEIVHKGFAPRTVTLNDGSSSTVTTIVRAARKLLARLLAQAAQRAADSTENLHETMSKRLDVHTAEFASYESRYFSRSRAR